jgi:hypothetical protein
MKLLTSEDIERLKTDRGGFTRETLASWGVSWPPEKGWKKRLLSNQSKIVLCDEQSMFDEESLELPF